MFYIEIVASLAISLFLWFLIFKYIIFPIEKFFKRHIKRKSRPSNHKRSKAANSNKVTLDMKKQKIYDHYASELNYVEGIEVFRSSKADSGYSVIIKNPNDPSFLTSLEHAFNEYADQVIYLEELPSTKTPYSVANNIAYDMHRDLLHLSN